MTEVRSCLPCVHGLRGRPPQPTPHKIPVLGDGLIGLVGIRIAYTRNVVDTKTLIQALVRDQRTRRRGMSSRDEYQPAGDSVRAPLQSRISRRYVLRQALFVAGTVVGGPLALSMLLESCSSSRTPTPAVTTTTQATVEAQTTATLTPSPSSPSPTPTATKATQESVTLITADVLTSGFAVASASGQISFQGNDAADQLPVQQILTAMADHWNLTAVPSTNEVQADPVKVLQFLLSTAELGGVDNAIIDFSVINTAFTGFRVPRITLSTLPSGQNEQRSQMSFPPTGPWGRERSWSSSGSTQPKRRRLWLLLTPFACQVTSSSLSHRYRSRSPSQQTTRHRSSNYYRAPGLRFTRLPRR